MFVESSSPVWTLSQTSARHLVSLPSRLLVMKILAIMCSFRYSVMVHSRGLMNSIYIYRYRLSYRPLSPNWLWLCIIPQYKNLSMVTLLLPSTLISTCEWGLLSRIMSWPTWLLSCQCGSVWQLMCQHQAHPSGSLAPPLIV